MEFEKFDLKKSNIIELAKLVFEKKIYYFDTKTCDNLCRVIKFQYVAEDDELSFESMYGDTLYIKLKETELDKIELYVKIK